jgi:integrase
VYELRWENLLLDANRGLIHVVKGKTRAARRLLHMVPAVYRALKGRHEAQGFPQEGWVLPTGSRSGHMEESSAKKWHAKALATSGLKRFEPYCLRHTALTWLGEDCRDNVFTLARIAGHTSIALTMCYIHPEAETIERVFERAARREVVTQGGHLKELPQKPVGSRTSSTHTSNGS